MNTDHLVRSAVGLQRTLIEHQIEFCFIGGIAVQYWGEPRNTEDLDVSVACSFGEEQQVISHLQEFLSPRIDNAERFARLHRVLLVQSDDGTPIDISLAAMPFELEIIRSADYQEMTPGNAIRLCSASALVLTKAFANRPRDWDDIRGVIVRSGGEINWPAVEQELAVLADLKGEPEILTQLARTKSSTE